MRSGLLNERLKVYAVTLTTSLTGEKVRTLTHSGTYWCRCLQSTQTLTTDDGRVIYDPNVRFELRRQIPIHDTDIVEYQQVKFVITAIDKNKNLDKQTLTCVRYEQ